MSCPHCVCPKCDALAADRDHYIDRALIYATRTRREPYVFRIPDRALRELEGRGGAS